MNTRIPKLTVSLTLLFLTWLVWPQFNGAIAQDENNATSTKKFIVINQDTSNYPFVEIEFFISREGTLVRDKLSVDDLRITENGKLLFLGDNLKPPDQPRNMPDEKPLLTYRDQPVNISFVIALASTSTINEEGQYGTLKGIFSAATTTINEFVNSDQPVPTCISLDPLVCDTSLREENAEDLFGSLRSAVNEEHKIVDPWETAQHLVMSQIDNPFPRAIIIIQDPLQYDGILNIEEASESTNLGSEGEGGAQDLSQSDGKLVIDKDSIKSTLNSVDENDALLFLIDNDFSSEEEKFSDYEPGMVDALFDYGDESSHYYNAGKDHPDPECDYTWQECLKSELERFRIQSHYLIIGSNLLRNKSNQHLLIEHVDPVTTEVSELTLDTKLPMNSEEASAIKSIIRHFNFIFLASSATILWSILVIINKPKEIGNNQRI